MPHFLGLGGVFFNIKWFSLRWPNVVSFLNIAYLEFFAVYVSVVTWGPELRHQHITISSDNEAITCIWQSSTSKDKSIMYIVLFFVCTKFHITVHLKHVPGKSNIGADLLSRFNSKDGTSSHGYE